VTLLVVLWIPLIVFLCCLFVAFYRLFLPESVRQRLKDNQMAIGVFFALCLLSLTGYTAAQHSMAARQDQEYSASVDEIVASLKQRFDIYLSELTSAKAMFDTMRHVERKDWEHYVASLGTSKNFPGTVGIAYAKVIAPKDKAAFEASMRAQGFAGFSVKPGGQRSLYSSVIYIDSRDPKTQRAFGYDMLTDAPRRQTMFVARDTGAVAMTSKLTLLSEDEVNYQPGFILITPVYRNGLSPSTTAERRVEVDGFLMTAFRIRDFMNGVVGVKNYQVDFRMYDGLKVSPDSFIYDFDGSPTMPQNQVSISFRKLQTMYIQGHPWTIEFVNRDNTPAHASDRLLPALVGWGGVLASVLVTAIVYFISSSKRRAVKYAEALHANLKKSQQDLLERNRAMEEKIAELDKLNRFMVERELRMIELKAENARLRTMDGGHL
jgi:CHASE1-domain containing sensor protein